MNSIRCFRACHLKGAEENSIGDKEKKPKNEAESLREKKPRSLLSSRLNSFTALKSSRWMGAFVPADPGGRKILLTYGAYSLPNRFPSLRSLLTSRLM